jgi:glycosyltransferase involved in cell wall biosynthesis
MKILSYSPFDDVGAFGYRQATAFDRVGPSDWRYRAVRGAPSYLQFPEHTPWDWDSILEYWREADVVHVHDGFYNLPQPHKPMVVTFHGTGFRKTPDNHLQLAARVGALPVVSTLDLWLLAPDDVIWAPQIDDLDRLATYRQQNFGKLRIGHAPTNRSLKSTDVFLRACERLSHDIELEVVLIEGKPWAECLPIKGTCDIFFDQTAFGYGGNAIECWAMGIPVVCGAPDATLDEYTRRFGALPFVDVDEASIYYGLAELVEPSTRARWGAAGRAHVEQHHSQEVGVARLTHIYERALQEAQALV